MLSEQPDPTLLNDEVFNIAAFYSAYSYLSLAAAKLLFGQLNFPNIWTQNNIFTQEIQVGVIGQFGVSSQGHCNMPSGQIDDEIALETNDGTIASTQFVHSVQNAIFASDNTWSGTNSFTGDAYAQTASQNTAQTSTLIATLQYTWESINTLLNTENTFSFLQHFTSGIETNTATISGLLSSNSITTNTLTISTSATTPNVSQANTPDTSVANTAYIWSSLGTFLGQTHSWKQPQTFGNVISTNIGTSTLSGNYIVGNSIVSNSSVVCVDLSASNSVVGNTAVFNSSCSVPTVTQLTTPSTSAASTRYVSDSLSSFLGLEHSWALAQHFLSGVTATSVDASNGSISSLGCNSIDVQSLYVHPPPAASSSSPFDRLQSAFTIASNYHAYDRLVLSASREQDNGSALIQAFIDGDTNEHIIYTGIGINPFGGLVTVNKEPTPSISPNTVALDVSGNIVCNANMSANTCTITANISASSCGLTGALTASTIDVSNATTSSLVGTYIESQTLYLHPPAPASSSAYDRLQNSFTIESNYDPWDRLVLTASRTQNNGCATMQAYIDGDSSSNIIYTGIDINPFGGLVSINKQGTATYLPNTIALDISGNVQCNADLSANTCHLTHGLSCEGISTIDISASGNIAAYSGTLSQSISLGDNSTRISTTKYVQDNLTNLKATQNSWSGRQIFTNPACMLPSFPCGYYLDAPGLDSSTPYVSDAYAIYPILCSTRRLSAIGVDNAWVVGAGYKFVLYLDVNYGGFHCTIDNYDRTFDFIPLPASTLGVVSEDLYLEGYPSTSLGANHVKSVRVYYQSDANEVTSLIMS